MIIYIHIKGVFLRAFLSFDILIWFRHSMIILHKSLFGSQIFDQIYSAFEGVFQQCWTFVSKASIYLPHTNVEANSQVHVSKCCCRRNVLSIHLLIMILNPHCLYSFLKKKGQAGEAYIPHQKVHLSGCIGNSWTTCGLWQFCRLEYPVNQKCESSLKNNLR